MFFFKHHVPKPPVIEHHPLFQAYLSKLEKSRKRLASSFRESSSVCTRDSRLKTRRLTDRVIRELNVRVFKLETIIQVLALERNDKLGRLQFNEDLSRLKGDFFYSLNILFQELVDPHDSVEDIDNEKRLRLEEEKMLQNAEVKKRKHYEFMNSTHVKTILGNFPPINRNDAHSVTCKAKPKESWVKIKKYRQNVNDPSLAELLKKVKPWVEDVSRLFHSMDTIWLSDDIERFISQPGQLKSMFPWSDDYTVSRNFWLRLVCLDPCRKGWLSEEVFIPINETDQHWCLAHLDILSGLVTFYDSRDTYDYEWHDWYVVVRQCLELYLLALSANSLLVKDMMVKLFEIDNERDLRTVADTYAMCQQLHVRCHERREQMLEMQSFLHVSTSLAESYKLLEELQDFELEKCRDLMKSISETQLKVLKKLSFIAKLRRQ
ncbi:phospholipase-like protein [Tanacetum coccineum]